MNLGDGRRIQGISGITLRQAMSHRAGLPALDVALTRDEVLGWDPVIRAIEDQRPLYPVSEVTRITP